MKVGEYVQTAEDMVILVDATPKSRVMNEATRKKIAEVQREIEENPTRVSDGKLKDDIAYKLGMKAGLTWINELVTACKEKLDEHDS
jgi:DNA recombination-dependent growth factor C